MQKWITLIPIFILELNLEEFQNGEVKKNNHRKKEHFYDIFLLASFICVRTVMLYATRISIVLSVFLQVLWKSEATSTFWGRTAQGTSARTTMTTASTRKTVTWSINNDRKSKRGREGRVAKRGKHVDRRRERSYSFQGTLQHRKVLSLATALVGPRTVTPANSALLRKTAWSIGL